MLKKNISQYSKTSLPAIGLHHLIERTRRISLKILWLILSWISLANLTALAQEESIFTIKPQVGYQEITDALGRSLYLVRRGQLPPPGLASHQYVEIPVRRTVVMSGTYDLGIMKALGILETLVGLANPDDSTNLPEIHLAHQDGRLPYLGLWNAPDYEKIKTLKPDLILNSDFRSLDIYEAMGYPVIYTFNRASNRLEDRLQFFRFLAAFYEKNLLADSLIGEFQATLKELADRAPRLTKPKVLYADYWQEKIQILPSDYWSSQLITHVGGELLFQEVCGQTEISSINPEEFYIRGQEADIFLPYRSSMFKLLTKSDLLLAHPLLSRFNVMQPQGRVFRPLNRMYSETGQLSAMARDLAAIVAPDLYPDHKLEFLAFVP